MEQNAETLETYEKASGQQLNKEKMLLFFSKNSKVEARAHILSTACLSSTESYENYLGLPALIGRSRVRSFKHIQGRIWDPINCWNERFLTHAGTKVLSKLVIQAILTYKFLKALFHLI